MNYDENYIHKYYVPFLSSKNHEDVYLGLKYDSEKRRVCRQKNIILSLLLNKPKGFEWQVSLLFFLNVNKLSSHTAQISKRINSPNKKSFL